MIKRIILVSSLFLTFESSAESISREEIKKFNDYNNYFDFLLKNKRPIKEYIVNNMYILKT